VARPEDRVSGQLGYVLAESAARKRAARAGTCRLCGEPVPDHLRPREFLCADHRRKAAGPVTCASCGSHWTKCACAEPKAAHAPPVGDGMSETRHRHPVHPIDVIAGEHLVHIESDTEWISVPVDVAAWLAGALGGVSEGTDEAQSEVARLRAENKALAEWKRSAMQVLGEWDAAYAALGAPGPMGGSKADAVRSELARKREALRLIAHATVYPDSAKFVPSSVSHMRTSDFAEWAQRIARKATAQARGGQ
jgi:hypothetical protein